MRSTNLTTGMLRLQVLKVTRTHDSHGVTMHFTTAVMKFALC